MRLYKIKLRIDLLDIYPNINLFRYLKNSEEIIIYDEIIKEEINQFLSLKASNKKDEARNKYLKKKIQTSLEKIAKENKDNLGLQLMLSTRFIEIIYMVNHSGYYQELFNVKITDTFNLRNGHRYSFQEDTFYVLYNDDVFVNLEDKPLIIDYTMLRDLEKLYLTDYIFKIDIEKVQVHIIALILILLNYQYNIDFLVSANHDTLTFSEGIREIRATDAILYESDFLEPYHNKKRYMLIVNIKHINLPSTLKVIGENTFYRFDLKDVILPDSVEEIERQAFNEEIMKKIENSKIKVKR